MTFTKPMIDLIKEIRKHTPADIKPGIKLANPDVIKEIIALYHTSNDTILRTLVKELCTLAGPDWLERLDLPTKTDEQKYVNKVYRGQTELVEASSRSDDEKNTAKKKPRVYRGVVVE